MKLTLFLFLGVLSCSVLAQKSYRSVSESKSGDGYTFEIKLDKAHAESLREAYGLLRGKPLDAKVSGVIFEEHDNGVSFRLNTRRNQLTITHDGSDADGRQEALELAAKVRKHLGLHQPQLPPPPPPAPALPGRG
ncbi:MAG: hypothetical protein AAFN92_18275 [Bacteroidota bacterium]